MKKERLRMLVGLVSAVVLACVAAPKQEAKAADPEFNPDDFVRTVDNRFFPLTPGTTYFYQGEKDGVPTSDEFVVSHQNKRILGVNCTVVRDRAFENGILVEDTIDWFAQDANGNVISTEGTWQAGVDGALPGIIMEADPRVGDRYQQEFAPDVAEDMARVLSLTESATVPYGEFDGLLLTKEWSPLDRGSAEHKYYAEGIGFILGVAVQGGDEISELVSITTGGRD